MRYRSNMNLMSVSNCEVIYLWLGTEIPVIVLLFQQSSITFYWKPAPYTWLKNRTGNEIERCDFSMNCDDSRIFFLLLNCGRVQPC